MYHRVIDNFVDFNLLNDFQKNYVDTGLLNVAFTNNGDDSLNLGTHGFTSSLPESLPDTDKIYPPLINYLYEKINPIAKKHQLEIYRWHYNLAPSSFDGTVHKDYLDKPRLTFIFCSSPEWQLSWGGELLLYDLNYEAKTAISYVPNRLIIINGFYPHRGLGPYRLINKIRTTIAFQTKDL